MGGNVMTKFDPIAVGDQIADHLAKADKAKASQITAKRITRRAAEPAMALRLVGRYPGRLAC
jgi:hypothetical protein